MENEQRYNFTAKSLHWLSAVIILWATASGLWLTVSDAGEDIKHFIAGFNVSLTTVFIPFFVWRIAHRICCGAPEHAVLTQKESLIATIMHVVMYIVVVIVLVSGVLMMGENISVFGVFSIPACIGNEEYRICFEGIHKYSSRFLGICVLIHVLAVVKHEVKGVKILRRMV